MSVNREIAPQTMELFRASEAGEADKVAALLKDPVVDINWHCTQSVLMLAACFRFKDGCALTNASRSMAPRL